MKLEFDSVSDLQQFLNWVHTYGAPRSASDLTINRTRNPIGGAPAAEAPATPYPKLDTGDVAFDTPQGAVEPSGIAPADLAKQADAERPGEPVNAAGKHLRKRRTKAEIDADEIAAAEKAGQAAIAAEAAAAKVQGESTDKAAEGPSTPSGTNPFEQVATAGDGPTPGVAGEHRVDAADRVAAEASGEEVVTPFLHLTRAREFIAKHGMPKYNESFTKAGLDPNVMGYNAEQRAQHMVTLADLDKA